MLAALRGEWPDRTPVMLHNFMAAAEEAGITMRQYRMDPRQIAHCLGDAAERYGLDGILVDMDTATLAGAIGVPVQFPEDAPARVHGSCLSSLEAFEDLAPVDVSQDPRAKSCSKRSASWSAASAARFSSAATAINAPSRWPATCAAWMSG